MICQVFTGFTLGGVQLENSLKRNTQMTQVDNMLKKASKRFMLWTLKCFGFSSDELHVVYGGYVRAILEYADVVWHSNITFKQSRDIESIQRRACRIILGNSYKMLMLWVLPIWLCSKGGRTIVIGMLKGCLIMSRLNLFSLLPDLSVMVTPYSANISQIPVRTKHFENSRIPYFIKILNK